jgi:hypothetical protein
MSAYPEHDKLAALEGANQVIGEFLEWIAAHPDLSLGEWIRKGADGGRLIEPRLIPRSRSIEDIIAEYFDINQVRLEAEKRAMLAEIRRAQS